MFSIRGNLEEKKNGEKSCNKFIGGMKIMWIFNQAREPIDVVKWVRKESLQVMMY